MTDGETVYRRSSPNRSNAERLVDEALEASQAPESEVRAIAPPLPQVVAFPDRYGWPSYTSRQPRIDGVLDTARLYDDAGDATSGGYSGSARNVQEDGY